MTDAFSPKEDPHYAHGWERERLRSDRGWLELTRTRELLTRYLPAPPRTVLDVGGGVGVHAVWLSGQGYTVHLIDAVALHIEQARESPGDLASVTLGDARALESADGSVDAVLLLGPLYHLTSRNDRLTALREARRVLAPGGVLFAVGISRFASLFDGLAYGYLADPAFEQIVERDLRDGQHRNPTRHPAYFTTAFFHRPEELVAEVEEAGIRVQHVHGVEGPGHWMTRHDRAIRADRSRQVSAARAVESEPSILGLSPHIMVVGRAALDAR